MNDLREKPFRISLGRIYANDGTARFISFAGRIKRKAGRVGRSGRGRTSHQSSRNWQAGQLFSRRVIVKVNLVKMSTRGQAAQALHLEYIQRESAARENNLAGDDRGELKQEHDKRGVLYNADEDHLNGEAFAKRGANDRHQFRIIVSPEDSRELLDLRAFTRDFIKQMETDLGTKLDWVAANHYDTSTPHTHIVVRGIKDNGNNLIIPREYISYGMRERAERLVTIELGPMNQRLAGLKLARQVTQQRFTGLDRSLAYMAKDNIGELSKRPPRGTEWSRRLDIARLKVLSRMGLAERRSPTQWKLEKDWDKTLRGLGERGDILKAYHRALNATNIAPEMRNSDASWGQIKYSSDMGTMIGKVIGTGVLDDVNDKAYLVVDGVDGQALYVDVGRAENIAGITKEYIVQIATPNPQPKRADKVITEIAAKNGGIYSADSHARQDVTARPNYIQAHIRRLEAMRRKGHVTRYKDGRWQIPGDYLKRAKSYEAAKTFGRPVTIKILSRIRLKQLATTLGRTWLDTELMSEDEAADAKGFGQELQASKALRRQYLLEQGIIANLDDPLTDEHLSTLERLDLARAGQKLSQELGKPYKASPKSGRMTGKCVKAIERPSGKYALIERARDFTLVPWRDMLERRIGKTITGQIRGDKIDWQIGRQKGIGIS